MPLTELPALLADEPGLTAVLGRRDAVLAVPEPARAIVVAGLAARSERQPIVVAVPTTGEAERLAQDLSAFLGADEVDLFPAWETLPFERVSPAVDTMGRRLRTLWHLRDPERAPRVVVAPVRALVQRLGPHVAEVEPIIVGVGDQVDPSQLLDDLVRAGYRREYQVEHRGEVAVRGSIVDVFPSTADGPVRIDLWGDEVDRLSEFSVADQRSTVERAEVEIFPCRELLPTDEVRERAAALVATEPWGREQWERLAEGQTFDGMESWLPWLVPDGRSGGGAVGLEAGAGAGGPVAGGEQVLFDLLDADALVLLVEPRRMRDRAADILAEELDLARTLARTWGVDDAEPLPPLHLSFDRLLTGTDAPAWSVTSVPEGPGVATVSAAGWDPVVGEGSTLIGQLEKLLGDGYRVVVAADGSGSADRLVALLGDQGIHLAFDERGRADLSAPGGHVLVQALERGFLLPAVKLAVLAESDVTGRRRAHRRAKPRKVAAQGYFDDLKPGDHVVHHQHGVARYGGMVTRTIGGVERDYLLLEYRGDDKLYVPSDQIDAVRHYTGGDNPSLSRLSGGEWQKSKAKVRAAVTEIAQELVVLYQKRVHTHGHAFAPDTPWQRELEESFPFEPTPDQAKAIVEVKGRHGAGVAYGPPGVRRRRVRQDRGRHTGRLQGGAGRPPGGGAGAHDPPCPAALPDLRRTICRLSDSGRSAEPLPDQRPGPQGDQRSGVGRRRRRHRHPPAAGPELRFKDLGLLVVDEEQRFGVSHKEAIKGLKVGVDVLTLSATPIPRTLEMSLTGIRDLTLLNTPPAERQPILTYVGEYDERAVGEAIRRELLREGQGLLRAQPGPGHRAGGRPTAGPGARGPDRGGSRPDGRGHPREGRHRLLGGPVRRAGVHDHHRVGHRHAHGETPWSWTGPTGSGWASSTSSGAAWDARGAGPTPISSSRRTAP